MAKRRGNLEGSIHKLPSGNWRAQLNIVCKRLSHTGQSAEEDYRNPVTDQEGAYLRRHPDQIDRLACDLAGS
ncbi:MAG: hypothetical protein EHM41_08200 [Chloroflexi bacterium]|nr:MAG: hypothetical protein EHM41_08200 [Chloroflexota bacterium]